MGESAIKNGLFALLVIAFVAMLAGRGLQVLIGHIQAEIGKAVPAATVQR